MSEITAHLYSINTIFPKPKQFNIPSFQREFVWNRQNILEMFEDFAEDSSNYDYDKVTDLNGYLMGSIVLINSKDSGKYIVVDGQQRLTTLTMIFKSISSKYKNMYDIDKKNDRFMKKHYSLEDYYYVDPDNENMDLKIKHDFDISYDKLYEKIINDELSDTDTLEYNTKSDANIVEVWNTINEEINSFDKETLVKFEEYLKNNVMLIQIECPDEDQALQLFEVLNNRGLPLEPLDLIKNLFLQLIESDNDLKKFDEYWKTFYQNMNVRENSRGNLSDHSSVFLKYFLMSNYGMNVSKKKLVRSIKKMIKDECITKDNILNFVQTLSEYSVIYKDMIEHHTDNLFSSTANMYSLNLLKIKQFHQVLMMFYFSDYANDEQLQKIREKVIIECIKMGMSTLYNNELPNKIERKIPDIVSAFKDNLSKTKDINLSTKCMFKVMRQYNVEKGSSLVDTLPNLKLSTRKAINLLKIFEVLFNKNNGITTRQATGKKITLEHILPQSRPNNIGKLGFNDEEDYDSTINNIGNLTLLHSDENDSLSNGAFSKKKDMYKDTDLNITKAISGNYNNNVKTGKNHDRIETLTKYYELSYADVNEWNKRCIKNRGRELSKLLVDFTTGKLDNWLE